jgi:predicted RNA-binding Zn-ribbon protein involved in translation (DUF1610 family)
MRLEDSIRFQLWRQATIKLGLKVEQITSCSWQLLSQQDDLIATIKYTASKPFDDRFSFVLDKQDIAKIRDLPDTRNYLREFFENTTSCQACEGSGEVIRQSQSVPCPNCGGLGWQSRTSNYYEA